MMLDRDLEPYGGSLASTKTGRVISVYSFSKVYAMTGWRLGYAVASPGACRPPAQAAGAGGVVPERDLAEGGRGRSARAPEGCGRRCETPIASGATVPGSSCASAACRLSDAGHLLHARGRLGAGHGVDGLHAEALERVGRRGRAGRGVRAGWGGSRARLAGAEEPDVWTKASAGSATRCRRSPPLAYDATTGRCCASSTSVTPSCSSSRGAHRDAECQSTGRRACGVAALVRERLGGRSVSSTFEEVSARRRRPNILARVDGHGRRTHAHACGHLDTKPPGDLEALANGPLGPVIAETASFTGSARAT